MLPLARSDHPGQAWRAAGCLSSTGRALWEQECMWAGPSLECIYRRLPAEWYPRGQLPARPCGQMFTEIAETDPPTHARIHSTSMLTGRSMLGPGQTPGARRGAGTAHQGLETWNHCAQGRIKKEQRRGGDSCSRGREAFSEERQGNVRGGF